MSVYFALCSGVMIAVQFWALPRLERRLGEPRLVVAALVVLSAGLVLLALANGGFLTAAAFVLAATGIGVNPGSDPTKVVFLVDGVGSCWDFDTCFTATAYGDLDGDGVLSAMIYSHPDSLGNYCESGIRGLSPPISASGGRMFDEVARVSLADEF